MARKSSSEHPIGSLERITIVMLGIYLAAIGVHTIVAGHLLYRNYLRTPVLAPVAVAIGAILIVAGFAMRH